MDKLCLEIMLDDHLVKNRTFLDYRKGLSGQVAILEFFQRGDPINLVQNLKTTLSAVFGKTTPRNNVTSSSS